MNPARQARQAEPGAKSPVSAFAAWEKQKRELNKQGPMMRVVVSRTFRKVREKDGARGSFVSRGSAKPLGNQEHPGRP